MDKKTKELLIILGVWTALVIIFIALSSCHTANLARYIYGG